MLSAWLTPPVLPLLKIYVFNITNPEEVRCEVSWSGIIVTNQLCQVMAGQDPVTEELGPFVYTATHLRRLVSVSIT